MMPQTIDLQVPPSAAELYAVIDVLVAVGLDLAHKDGQVASAVRSRARWAREREGLDIALCMLGELAALQSAGPVEVQAPVRSISQNGAGGMNGDGLKTTPVNLLLHRIDEKYLGR